MKDSKMILIWNKIVVGAQTGNTRLLNEADKELREYFDSEISKAKEKQLEILIERAKRYAKNTAPRVAYLMCDRESYDCAWKDIISNLESELDKLSKKNKCSGK